MGTMTARWIRFFGAAIGALAAAAGPALAVDCETPADCKGVLTVTGENDSLSSGADRNYTNGLRISYVGPVGALPKWMENVTREVSKVTEAIGSGETKYWGLAVGQSIFTPEDISATTAPPDQHPYAGWLYAQALVVAQDERHVDLYQVDLGIVGPAALGEEAQQSVHKLLGAPDPRGWDAQLGNELAFAATWERRWNIGKSLSRGSPIELDVTPGVGVTLGTLRTEAKVGAAARVGTNLRDDFGPPRVRPALAGLEYFKHRRASVYAFAGVDLRGVAHDLFLDGNTFASSANVERKPWVADLQAGIALQGGDWRLVYTYVTRTEEFTTQQEQQDFGVVSLSWRI